MFNNELFNNRNGSLVSINDLRMLTTDFFITMETFESKKTSGIMVINVLFTRTFPFIAYLLSSPRHVKKNLWIKSTIIATMLH
jgi:hypothetical protein